MRLDIDQRGGAFYIGFYDNEAGDLGLMLGQEWPKNKRRARPADADDAEVWDAEHAIAKLADGRDDHGFYFESKAAALRARAAANAAIKAGRENRVLAEWEKTALANGWRPPKGWTGPKTEKG